MKLSKSSKAFLNLNDHHSDASIHCRIEFYADKGTSHSGNISIRDCSRKIDLAIGVYDENKSEDSTYVNSIVKIDTLIKELEKCKQFLFIARADYLRRLKEEQEEIDKHKKNDRPNS